MGTDSGNAPTVAQGSLARGGARGRKQRRRSTSLRCLHARRDEGPLRLAHRCHVDLYEEAFARQQRLRDLKEDAEQAWEREEKQRLTEFAQGMRERRRFYRTKDTRTHLQREAEHLRRREDAQRRKEAAKQAQEVEELRECTFHPKLLTAAREGHRRALPTSSSLATDTGTPASLSRLRKLAERQHAATAALQVLASDEAQLRERLLAMRAELQQKIQLEETRRMVAVLQSTDAGRPPQQELARRVQAAAAGSDATAVQALVGELVGCSRDEVQRRVQETLQPWQLEAQGELYRRRLALVRELEAVEAEASALPGAALRERAVALGVDFGLAEHARRSLPAQPQGPLAPPLQLAPASPRTGRSGCHGAGGPQPTPQQSQCSRTPRSPRSPGSECSCGPEPDGLEPLRRRLAFPDDEPHPPGRRAAGSWPDS